MESKKSVAEIVTWYSGKRSIYEQLSKKVESIIREIIADEGIPFHEVNSRTKEISSFAKKIEDPKYSDPITQITDLAGIRIITYVESDSEKVCKVLEANLEIDPENSIDKSKSLGVDKVGYRSIHYVAKLPPDRIKLPEYKKFKGLYFEIQIRTILQHAWAEIEHDKNYKFSGELPVHLKRRFKVLAGVLELADREFNLIANEIDDYIKVVNSDTKKGKLDISIDSTSIKAFLKIRFETLIKSGLKPEFVSFEHEKLVLTELKNFGISTLKELDEIIPKDFIDRVLEYEIPKNEVQNYGGLLRDLMMISNISRYFEKCWLDQWQSVDMGTVDLLNSYNPSSSKVFEQHEIKPKPIK